MFSKWKKLYHSLVSHLYTREEYIKELEEKIRVLEVEQKNVSSVLPRVVYDKLRSLCLMLLLEMTPLRVQSGISSAWPMCSVAWKKTL